MLPAVGLFCNRGFHDIHTKFCFPSHRLTYSISSWPQVIKDLELPLKHLKQPIIAEKKEQPDKLKNWQCWQMSAMNAFQAFVSWLPYLDPLKNAFGCFLFHGHSLAFL